MLPRSHLGLEVACAWAAASRIATCLLIVRASGEIAERVQCVSKFFQSHGLFLPIRSLSQRTQQDMTTEEPFGNLRLASACRIAMSWRDVWLGWSRNDVSNHPESLNSAPVWTPVFVQQRGTAWDASVDDFGAPLECGLQWVLGARQSYSFRHVSQKRQPEKAVDLALECPVIGRGGRRVEGSELVGTGRRRRDYDRDGPVGRVSRLLLLAVHDLGVGGDQSSGMRDPRAFELLLDRARSGRRRSSAALSACALRALPAGWLMSHARPPHHLVPSPQQSAVAPDSCTLWSGPASETRGHGQCHGLCPRHHEPKRAVPRRPRQLVRRSEPPRNP